jgi:transcriptional regulator with XRE-family HTH domain
VIEGATAREGVSRPGEPRRWVRRNAGESRELTLPRKLARRSNALGLPDRIALVRVHLGLAQGAFAARIGVSRNTVIADERGHTTPRATTLRRIAVAAGVTVEALRDGAAPHWLQDGAWEEAVALLRAVWRDASRRGACAAPAPVAARTSVGPR